MVCRRFQRPFADITSSEHNWDQNKVSEASENSAEVIYKVLASFYVWSRLVIISPQPKHFSEILITLKTELLHKVFLLSAYYSKLKACYNVIRKNVLSEKTFISGELLKNCTMMKNV